MTYLPRRQGRKLAHCVDLLSETEWHVPNDVVQSVVQESYFVRRFATIRMLPNLTPSQPLSQVVFIHDYLQLVFQADRFSIYSLAEIEAHGAKVAQGQSGFCDAVFALIGQRVVEVSQSPSHVLVLTFEKGTQFSVRTDVEAITGPRGI